MAESQDRYRGQLEPQRHRAFQLKMRRRAAKDMSFGLRVYDDGDVMATCSW